MEMFLTVLVLSLLGVAVSAGLFAAATRDERARQSDSAGVRPLVPAPRFFAREDASAARQVPIELLLLQIEHHVRLEQAAAESFHHDPTLERLHTRTSSTLVH